MGFRLQQEMFCRYRFPPCCAPLGSPHAGQEAGVDPCGMLATRYCPDVALVAEVPCLTLKVLPRTLSSISTSPLPKSYWSGISQGLTHFVPMEGPPSTGRYTSAVAIAETSTVAIPKIRPKKVGTGFEFAAVRRTVTCTVCSVVLTTMLAFCSRLSLVSSGW